MPNGKHCGCDGTDTSSRPRFYTQIDEVTGTHTSGDYYRSTEIRRVTLYLDEETGVVVHDKEAFENWLRGKKHD